MKLKLLPTEKENLAECEDIIEKHLTEFYEVGFALMRIKDQELYRENYKTFEEYCHEKWGFSRPRAYQLMKAYEVHEDLSTIVDKPALNEAQARCLGKLKTSIKRQEAYRRALESAPEGFITAAHINNVIREMEPKITKRAIHRLEIVSSKDGSSVAAGGTEDSLNDNRLASGEIISDAMILADQAIALLEKIRVDEGPKSRQAMQKIVNWVQSVIEEGQVYANHT